MLAGGWDDGGTASVCVRGIWSSEWLDESKTFATAETADLLL